MVAPSLVTMSQLRFFLSLFAFVQTCRCHFVTAIVVNSTSRIPKTETKRSNPQALPPSSQITSSPSSTRRQFRIRKTKSSDLDSIATMLAMASISSNQQLNKWKRGIEFLRAKSLLEKQLSHRLLAVEEGRKTMQRYKNSGKDLGFDFSTGNIADYQGRDLETTCRLLWANDNFRSKLKSAVMISTERHAWERHNFDFTPLNAALFNHLMMTVIETCYSGEENVVGFCEVAWLPGPNANFSGDLSECSPSIVNLITSPSHRRRGIASKLIDVASRYTRTQWGKSDIDGKIRCTDRERLGLYVHPENAWALYLYRRKGFRVEKESDNGMLYMMKSA